MRFLAIFLVALIFASVAYAQTPTPTATVTVTATPTQTATPSACENVQSCVDTGVSAERIGCTGSNPTCTYKKIGRFAVSATELAERAVLRKNCRNRVRKVGCNACYALAKEPLKSRYDGTLFHGLLANAVSIIEKERKSRCPKLP